MRASEVGKPLTLINPKHEISLIIEKIANLIIKKYE